MLSESNQWKFVSAGLLPALIFLSGCNLAANRQNAIGRRAYESGQIAQAITNFRRALTLDPQSSDAYYNLASSYYQLGKQSQNQQWITQAEQLFRQSIALNDQHIDAHRALAALLVETNRERYAFDLVNDWRQRYPQSAEPLIEIARLYQEYGDNRRATDFLSDAVRVDSRNVRALKALGHVREVQGQLNLALENYNRALSLDNRQADVAQRVQQISARLAQQPQNTTR
jgi:Tfp pilus assembly protein PilF